MFGSVFMWLCSMMVCKAISILLLIIGFGYSAASNCIISKIKSVKVPPNEDLCKTQFEGFIDALNTNEKWAKDSKLHNLS